MSSFTDQLAADNAAVFFNEDDFAQEATYFEKGGDPAGRPVIFVEAMSPRREEIAAHHELQADQKQFLTPRVAVTNAAGVTFQPVTNPQRGDAWSFPDDPPNTRWDFVEVVDSDAYVFNLRIQKKTMLRAGQPAPPQL